MIRKIAKIDKEKYSGCGLCVNYIMHEGAIVWLTSVPVKG